MTFIEYRDLAHSVFPNHFYNTVDGTYQPYVVDMIKGVAIDLFMSNKTSELLTDETKKQLAYYNEHFHIKFD